LNEQDMFFNLISMLFTYLVGHHRSWVCTSAWLIRAAYFVHRLISETDLFLHRDKFLALLLVQDVLSINFFLVALLLVHNVLSINFFLVALLSWWFLSGCY